MTDGTSIKPDKAVVWGLRIYLFLVGFSVFGSVMEKVMGTTEIWIARIVGLSILTLGGWLVSQLIPLRNGWITVLGIGLIGGIFEIVGVLTGFPFGEYSYSTNWWPTIPIFSGEVFPIPVVLAWGLVVGALSLLSICRFGRKLGLAATSAMAAFIDLPMEPVLTKGLGYWQWEQQGPLFGVPISNFFGWMFVAFVASFVMTSIWPSRMEMSLDSTKRVKRVLYGHLVLMGFLGLVNQIWDAGFCFLLIPICEILFRKLPTNQIEPL